MDPGQPGRGEAARGSAARLDLPGRVPDFVPGLRRIVDVEAGLLEDVLVVVEDRRGRVVGEGQHGAVRLRIIGDDARQILALVEGRSAHRDHVGDRLHGVFGGHHGAGAGVEDLDDVRRLAGAVGGDAGVQRLGIGALEDRNDLVVALAVVEFLGKRFDDLVVGAGHGVPPGNLGDGEGGRRGQKGESNGRTGRKALKFHRFLSRFSLASLRVREREYRSIVTAGQSFCCGWMTAGGCPAQFTVSADTAIPAFA